MQNITALVRSTHIISGRRGRARIVIGFTRYNSEMLLKVAISTITLILLTQISCAEIVLLQKLFYFN